jgi:hypothetical protein
MEQATTFNPRLDILPAAQRRLWPELAAVPKEFALYGGTALALHLGHRNSEDFDFFGVNALNQAWLLENVPFLEGAEITQQDTNTLTANVDRAGLIKVSFFGVPRLRQLRPPLIAPDNGLKVASIPDLAGTKAAVVQQRAEAKDYIDIDALIRIGKSSLPLALAAAQRIYGSGFNPQITLKSLSYFDDGNLRELADDLKLRLVNAARDVDLDHLPNIDSPERNRGDDLGLEL